MPTKKKEYVKFGTTKIRIPKKMVGFDKQDKLHIYNTITPKRKLSYHNKKVALDINVNNNTKTKINRVPNTTKLIKAIEEKKKRKPRKPRLPPAAALAPPPPPPPPFQPPAPPAPRPPPPVPPRPDNPPYQPPPRPPPVAVVPAAPLVAPLNPNRIQAAIRQQLARQQLTTLKEQEKTEIKLFVDRVNRENKVARFFEKVSTNFLEADRQNFKLDIVKGQAQQALNILQKKQEEKLITPLASVNDFFFRKPLETFEALEKASKNNISISELMQKLPLREKDTKELKKIKKENERLKEELSNLLEALKKIQAEKKVQVKENIETTTALVPDVEITPVIKKPIKKPTKKQIEVIKLPPRPPPTQEQIDKSRLLLQKLVRGHKGRKIVRNIVLNLRDNMAANIIKTFMLRTRLKNLLYNAFYELYQKQEEAKLNASIEKFKKLAELDEETFKKEMKRIEDEEKELKKLEQERLKLENKTDEELQKQEEIEKDIEKETQKLIELENKRKQKDKELKEAEKARLENERQQELIKNKEEMDTIYRNIGTFKPVKEKKPRIKPGYEEDPIEQIIYEDKLNNYAANIIQSKIRRLKKNLQNSIDLYYKLEEEWFERTRKENELFNSSFDKIWVDPDEIKSEEVKSEEVKVEGKILKPKKKVMTMPKPID